MGIVSALGAGKAATLEALEARRSGVEPVRYLETGHTDIPVGEVKATDAELRSRLGIPPEEPMTRTALLGMVALDEALEEARFAECRPVRTAFISGTTVGGMDTTERYYHDCLETDSRRAYIALHDCGASTRSIASRWDGFDVMSTPSTACSSAANSIVLGADLIRNGRVEAAVVGGSECLTCMHLNGFNALMIVDRERCRPFDKARNGINLGEGAAYLVLETESSARRRGVQPLCILSGYANACDAFHQTASSPDGEGAYLAMRRALEESGLQPADIGYINAHGTGTGNNDESEGIAIMRLFGDDRVPPVSSTKPFTGHTTSASGSIEAVISILSLRAGRLPVNLGFREKIDTLSFEPVTDPVPPRPLRHVLLNAFGFGGNDTVCVFSSEQ